MRLIYASGTGGNTCASQDRITRYVPHFEGSRVEHSVRDCLWETYLLLRIIQLISVYNSTTCYVPRMIGLPTSLGR